MLRKSPSVVHIIVRSIIIGVMPGMWGWYVLDSWQWWVFAIGFHVMFALQDWERS